MCGAPHGHRDGSTPRDENTVHRVTTDRNRTGKANGGAGEDTQTLINNSREIWKLAEALKAKILVRGEAGANLGDESVKYTLVTEEVIEQTGQEAGSSLSTGNA